MRITKIESTLQTFVNNTIRPLCETVLKDQEARIVFTKGTPGEIFYAGLFIRENHPGLLHLEKCPISRAQWILPADVEFVQNEKGNWSPMKMEGAVK